MGKGEETRQHIIEQAAGLFNQKGFAGASMSDIMEATGLQKGGIYRHFDSKEELAREGFALAVRRMGARFKSAVQGGEDAVERLQSIVDVYARVPNDPPVPGGCPILAAAVESDFGAEVLKPQVTSAVESIRRLIRNVVEEGVETGELRSDADGDAVASILIGSLEGGIMLTQLMDDPRPLERVRAHLERWLDAELRS